MKPIYSQYDKRFDRQLKKAAQEADKYANQLLPVVGPLAFGNTVKDTDHGGCLAVLVSLTPDSAVVVYLDEPDCIVSCGNHPDRWQLA